MKNSAIVLVNLAREWTIGSSGPNRYGDTGDQPNGEHQRLEGQESFPRVFKRFNHVVVGFDMAFQQENCDIDPRWRR
jgi:hypothetical protein